MSNGMIRYIPTEFTDYEGNVRYPHSQASVIFMDDGQRVQNVLARLDTLLDTIETITSSSEIDSGTALVTAAALAEVKALYTELNSDLSALNGAGAIKGIDIRKDGVYITYVPIGGADAVSKKLGDANFTISLSGSGHATTGGGTVYCSASRVYTQKDGVWRAGNMSQNNGSGAAMSIVAIDNLSASVQFDE